MQQAKKYVQHKQSASLVTVLEALSNQGNTVTRSFKRTRLSMSWILGAVVVLICVRLALPFALKSYVNHDVQHGQFAMFTSFAAKEGKYEGYYKVFFKDLEVFKWEKERKKNILEIFWQAIVGTLTTAFKNHSKDQLATKIPVTGSFEKTDVHIWPTVETLLSMRSFHRWISRSKSKMWKIKNDLAPNESL
jgi:hypothetical protein